MKKLIFSLFFLSVLAVSPAFAESPMVFSPNSQYLGNLNSDPTDINSINNPVGVYGSPVSPYSINNPVGVYGSPVSPMSPRYPINVPSGPMMTPPPLTSPPMQMPAMMGP